MSAAPEALPQALPDALVVDDDAVNRLIASRMLQRLGWSVAEREDGDDALTFLAEHHVEVVLLDISMPRLDGEEVCRRIRGMDTLQPKVIAYTAHAMPEERRRYLETGFDSLLVKPITRLALLGVLSDVGIAPRDGATP